MGPHGKEPCKPYKRTIPLTRVSLPFWQHQVVEGWRLPLLFFLVHPLLFSSSHHPLSFINCTMSWVFDPVLPDLVDFLPARMYRDNTQVVSILSFAHALEHPQCGM